MVLVARARNIDIWRAGVGDGKTHLAGVDLLAAEAVVVGTHVGGVGAVPVVLVVGLSSVAVGSRNLASVGSVASASLNLALVRYLGADTPLWLVLPSFTSRYIRSHFRQIIQHRDFRSSYGYSRLISVGHASFSHAALIVLFFLSKPQALYPRLHDVPCTCSPSSSVRVPRRPSTPLCLN